MLLALDMMLGILGTEICVVVTAKERKTGKQSKILSVAARTLDCKKTFHIGTLRQNTYSGLFLLYPKYLFKLLYVQ